MSSIAEAVPRPQLTVDPGATKFFGAILLVSFGSWLLAPWQMSNMQSVPVADALWLIMVLGIAHVGMTGFFWIDQRYSTHIASRPRTFYLAPALVAVVSLGVTITLGRLGFVAITAANTAWLFYHYAKQNWGLLALSATASAAPRAIPTERWLYIIGSIGGTLAVIRELDPALQFIPAQIGPTIIGGVALVSAATAIHRVLMRRHTSHVLLTAFSGVFFLPISLFGPLAGPFIMGTAHSFQYAVIMTVLASNRARGRRLRGISALLICGAMVAATNVLFNARTLWGEWADVLNVAYLCISMWHFIADADLWRLREPFQRQALRESLPFLFR